MAALILKHSMTLLIASMLSSISSRVTAFHVAVSSSRRPAAAAFGTWSTTRLFGTEKRGVPSKQQTNTPSNTTVPVTLLSGFLGTGKTTALKHLLENAENVKIGVVVNDVASVNIDAKLVTAATGDMVELQNGCACCSLADELFFSVEKLLAGRDLDAVVIELSGVADPMMIQSNWAMAPSWIQEMAALNRVVTLVDAATFGTDYMTWDMASERKGWVAPGDDCAGNRKVSELLAEQVEAADLVLVNKVDMAGAEQIEIATKVARALNEKAEVAAVEFGRIAPKEILGEWNGNEEQEVCEDPDCTDTSHSHAHDHADEELTSHSHDHDHACDDPDCTDTSHSHSHSHSTSTDELGISSFVYKRSLPFHPVRLMDVLNKWPVPVKDTIDLGLLKGATEDGYEIGGEISNESPFVGVLRSKGFCWFAPNKWNGASSDPWRHDTTMYWSMAGRQFGISSAGKWWATISKYQMKKMLAESPDDYERILKDDFVSEEFGDRRQELVFIGTNLKEEEITAALDACLYTEKEMDSYRQKLRNYQDTILAAEPRRGLFKVGGADHTDVQ